MRAEGSCEVERFGSSSGASPTIPRTVGPQPPTQIPLITYEHSPNPEICLIPPLRQIFPSQNPPLTKPAGDATNPATAFRMVFESLKEYKWLPEAGLVLEGFGPRLPQGLFRVSAW